MLGYSIKLGRVLETIWCVLLKDGEVEALEGGMSATCPKLGRLEQGWIQVFLGVPLACLATLWRA